MLFCLYLLLLLLCGFGSCVRGDERVTLRHGQLSTCKYCCNMCLFFCLIIDPSVYRRHSSYLPLHKVKVEVSNNVQEKSGMAVLFSATQKAREGNKGVASTGWFVRLLGCLVWWSPLRLRCTCKRRFLVSCPTQSVILCVKVFWRVGDVKMFVRLFSTSCCCRRYYGWRSGHG